MGLMQMLKGNGPEVEARRARYREIIASGEPGTAADELRGLLGFLNLAWADVESDLQAAAEARRLADLAALADGLGAQIRGTKTALHSHTKEADRIRSELGARTAELQATVDSLSAKHAEASGAGAALAKLRKGNPRIFG